MFCWGVADILNMQNSEKKINAHLSYIQMFFWTFPFEVETVRLFSILQTFQEGGQVSAGCNCQALFDINGQLLEMCLDSQAGSVATGSTCTEAEAPKAVANI